MADGTVGNAAIDRASHISQGKTYLIYQNSCSKKGNLYKVDFYAAAITDTKSAKVKVFREVGANFVQVGAASAITSAELGLNTVTLATPISVEIGDYIAWWTDGTNYIILDEDDSGGNDYYYSGDVTGTLAKASWTYQSNIQSLYGYIRLPAAGGFSGGQPWIFMKDMWEKHNKLWIPKLILPKDLGFSY